MKRDYRSSVYRIAFLIYCYNQFVIIEIEIKISKLFLSLSFVKFTNEEYYK